MRRLSPARVLPRRRAAMASLKLAVLFGFACLWSGHASPVRAGSGGALLDGLTIVNLSNPDGVMTDACQWSVDYLILDSNGQPVTWPYIYYRHSGSTWTSPIPFEPIALENGVASIWNPGYNLGISFEPISDDWQLSFVQRRGTQGVRGVSDLTAVNFVGCGW